ncbi:MAG: GNAT family N-acetyltransferase [Bacteroidota bacterium]
MADILKEAFDPFKSLYSPEAYANTVVGEQVIQQRVAAGFSWLFVEEDIVLGTVSAVPTWEGLYVTGMAVLPLAQGKKVAYRLMDRLEKCSVEKGVERLYLYTTPFLHKAVNLYEKFGFTRYGNPQDQWMGTTLIQFEKMIGVQEKGN